MKVSVIIPCFNQERYIQEAIESVINQTYKNIEIICVNDGSSDNSSKIIRNLVNKYKNIFYFELEKNKGVVYARNMAIDSASGEYILPLDADDKIEPNYIEKAVKILDNNSNIGIVYCKARMFGLKNKYWNLPSFNLNDFIYENCIFSCALFRKKDFISAGKYKENMTEGCEDWDLWLSLIELGLKPYRIEEVLFNYRQVKNSRRRTVGQCLDWKRQLVKNHFDLYLNDKDFTNKVFTNIKKLKDKLKKYKKLFYLFLILFVLTLGILLWVMILN